MEAQPSVLATPRRARAVAEAAAKTPWPNVGRIERLASVAAGAALVALGRRLRAPLVLRKGVAALGVPLLLRGLTGRSRLYRRLGIDTADSPRLDPEVLHGINVVRTATINRPPGELYRLWHDLPSLPRFMKSIRRVSATGNGTSHWAVAGPLGRIVEFDAAIVKDERDALIEWRSVGGAVRHAGSVRFERAPAGRGTIVTVTVRYAPPAGILGYAVAKLSGEDPARQIASDLRRFKQVAETGEVATIEGQPAGRRS
jgi:uncharacterized membrane protein